MYETVERHELDNVRNIADRAAHMSDRDYWRINALEDQIEMLMRTLRYLQDRVAELTEEIHGIHP